MTGSFFSPFWENRDFEIQHWPLSLLWGPCYRNPEKKSWCRKFACSLWYPINLIIHLFQFKFPCGNKLSLHFIKKWVIKYFRSAHSHSYRTNNIYEWWEYFWFVTQMFLGRLKYVIRSQQLRNLLTKNDNISRFLWN